MGIKKARYLGFVIETKVTFPEVFIKRLTLSTTSVLILRVLLKLPLCRLILALPLGRFDATGRQVEELWILVVIKVSEERIEPDHD